MALPGYNAPSPMGGDDWQTQLGNLAIGVGFPYAGMMGMDTADPKTRQAMIAASLLSLAGNFRPGKGVGGVVGGLGNAIGSTMQQGMDGGVQMTRAMDYFDRRNRDNRTRQWMRDNAAKFGLSPEMIDAADPSDLTKLWMQEVMRGRQEQRALEGFRNMPRPAYQSPLGNEPSGERSGGVPAAPPATGNDQSALRPHIQNAATSLGLPQADAMALVGTESDFKVGAIGPDNYTGQKARGATQIMPATAREVAGKIGVPYDEARLTSDPGYNVQLGLNYYKQMLDKYGGNAMHAGVAYNWGPGNADAWIAAGADPAKLPAETRGWLQRFGQWRQRFSNQTAAADSVPPGYTGIAPHAGPQLPPPGGFAPSLPDGATPQPQPTGTPSIPGPAGGQMARAPLNQSANVVPSVPGASTTDVPPAAPQGERAAPTGPVAPQVAQASGRLSDALSGGAPTGGAPAWANQPQMPQEVRNTIRFYERAADQLIEQAYTPNPSLTTAQRVDMVNKAQAFRAEAQKAAAHWATTRGTDANRAVNPDGTINDAYVEAQRRIQAAQGADAAALAGKKEFDQKIATKDAERIDALHKGATASRTAAQGAAFAAELLKNNPIAGAGAEHILGFAKLLQRAGIDVQGTSDAEVAQSIVAKLGPQLRPEGSGAVSDFEQKLFLSALPGLARTPEGSVKIAEVLSRIAERDEAAAELANQYPNGLHGTDFSKKLAELRKQPLFTTKEWDEIKGLSELGKPAAKQTQGGAATPANPNLPPEGTIIRGPEGKERIWRGGRWYNLEAGDGR